MTTCIDNNTGHRTIVVYSGGYDSTYVLAGLVAEANDGDTICALSVNHSLTGMMKLRREYESQLLILRELRKRYPKVNIEHEVIKVESNWISGPTTNSTGLAQPILWVCNILPLLSTGDKLYFGYNLSDQAHIHLDDIKSLVDAACKIQNNKNIELIYPLKYYTKTEVVRLMIDDFPYLVDLCTSCESLRYEGEKVCGECTPCTHLKEALMNISLDKSQSSEKAAAMLKELFGLTISVSYDDQLKELSSTDVVDDKNEVLNNDNSIDCE